MKKRKETPEEKEFRLVESRLQRIARFIQGMLPESWGFALITFPFSEDPGPACYVSNGRREDIIEALREAAGRLEGRQDNPPGADPRIYTRGES